MSFPIRATSLILIATLLCVPVVRIDAESPNSLSSAQPQERPAMARLLEVRAITSNKGVLVQWSTEPYSDVLGFNVYRIRNLTATQLNSGLVAGSALISGRRNLLYSWFDPTGTSENEYSVEAINLKGETILQDRESPVWQRALPEFQQSPILADLGANLRVAVSESPSLEENSGKEAISAAAEPLGSLSLTEQWDIANQPALKIGVRAEGWYRLTQPQMAAAGFATNGDARNLRLFVSGSEIAIRVSRDTGPLTSTDFVEFWGQGLDLTTTDTQVYWLINGSQPGLRIATKNDLSTDTASDTSARSLAPQPDTSVLPPYFFGLSGLMLDVAKPQAVESGKPPEAKAGRELTPPQIISEPVVPLSLPEIATESLKEKGESETPVAISNPDPKASEAATNANAPKALTRRLKVAKGKKLGKASSKATFLRSKKRKGRQSRARRARRHHHATTTAAVAPAFSYSLKSAARSVYYAAALNGDHENFFGPVIVGDGPLVTLTLHHVELSSTAPAQLQVALQGVSLETHQVRVFVNGSLAGLATFNNQTAVTQTFAIPTSWLVEGDNLVKLSPIGSSHDTSVADYVRITYPHGLTADNDSLQLSLKSTQEARVDGFSVSNIRVLDITDPKAVEDVHVAVQASGNGFAAVITPGDRGKPRRLVALPDNRLSQPAFLALNQLSTLNRSTNAANFVIIAYKDFIPALAPLVAQRQAQGFSVAVVNVEDIFDEFSYGVHSPQAIREFMSLARAGWVTPPAYLLLVGDASYDARNYTGLGNFDLVPTKLIDTGISGDPTALETASDDWMTDFDNDGIADISTGRLAVRTLSDANLMVSKIVNYVPANTPQSALLVADTQGSYFFNFEAASDEVGALLPPTMTIQKVYRRLQPSDADTRTNIIAGLNAGQAVAVYSGHGNVNIWAGSIFTANDAAALTNGNRLPFVVVMDCLNGFFADPSLQSIAESLLRAPNGGAVATFASSGLTLPTGQHEMGLRMFELLYEGAAIPIGDASRQAKAATADNDVRRTWILLGDPSVKIR